MSEDVWREIASKLRYCHGTSSKFVPSIRKYGLLPRKTDDVVRPSVYSGELESKKLDSVYLSLYYDKGTHFCHVGALRASEKVGGEPTIVDVKLDKEDFKRFESDEDKWSEDSWEGVYKNACHYVIKTGELDSAACMDTPVKEGIEEAVKEGKLTREEACNAPAWFREIVCFGKLAIKDGVPPEKITGAKKWEPK